MSNTNETRKSVITADKEIFENVALQHKHEIELKKAKTQNFDYLKFVNVYNRKETFFERIITDCYMYPQWVYYSKIKKKTSIPYKYYKFRNSDIAKKIRDINRRVEYPNYEVLYLKIKETEHKIKKYTEIERFDKKYKLLEEKLTYLKSLLKYYE